MPVAALTIDLDTLPHYGRIHGLQLQDSEVVYQKGVRRFLEFAGRWNIPATLFCIGADALQPPARVVLKEAAGRHELASHSHTHPYNFHQLSAEAIERELHLAEDALAAVSGRPVKGFRAPGYQVSATLLSVLQARGYQYDSSILPAFGYWLARASVLAWMKVLRRSSAAHAGNPRQFVPRTQPYQADLAAPWRRAAAGVLEIPLTAWLGVPWIGTGFALLPEFVLDWGCAALKKRSHLVLEFHAVDFLEAEDDPALQALAMRQPDLRVSWAEKRRRFDRVLNQLQPNRQWKTLLDISRTEKGMGA